MGKFCVILFLSMDTFCIFENTFTAAWVNNMMSKIEDGKMQKLDELHQIISSKYYQEFLNSLSIKKKERQKRQIEEPAYLGATRIFTKLDNTVASMITTVAIHELNDMNVYIATKLNCLKYVAKTIQMINNQTDNGSIIWIFMLIIYWMLMPVFIWIAIILFMWKNLRYHWRKIIIPLATAKHCEVSGNLLNARNEIITMPAWDGVLEARFEQTTQSEHDEIDWSSEENPAEMQDEKK
uniref:Chloride channel CLIC-like protein 1 n=1 Tax=Onchocerca volvulus TaxID=6282 RepID=A0A2K6VG06_ONCVO